MNTFATLLLIILLVCAISVSFTNNLLNAVIIFSAYSFVMAIIWFILESPDLAITEAAVGAGVTSILFFVTLKKMNQIHIHRQQPKDREKALEAKDNRPFMGEEEDHEA